MTNMNDLPDHLLLYIISFLPTLDAIQTSFLSRRYRNLWTTTPSLDFDFSLFPISGDISSTRRRFADFISRTLILRPPTPLTKFRLQFHFYEQIYSSHLDSWIQYAIKHKANQLDVDFYINRSYHTREFVKHDYHNEVPYEFPLFLLNDSCVKVLRLTRQYLLLPAHLSTIKFVSIASLSLDNIFLSDEMITDLVSACVNLEFLYLEDCYGMNNFRICSGTLKELVILQLYTENVEEGQVLEISAPNLESITLDCVKMSKYVMNDCHSLVKANVYFPFEFDFYEYWCKIVRLFCGVKWLAVQNWWFELLVQNIASSEQYALNNLDHLELETEFTDCDLHGIAELLNISPNLNTLILKYIPKQEETDLQESLNLSDEDLKGTVQLCRHHLKQVKLQFFDEENVSRILLLLQKVGITWDKLVIVPARNCGCRPSLMEGVV